MRSSGIAAAILASALAGVAQQASAQEQLTAGQALAGVIRDALAPSSYGDWRYSWDAVSIRISGQMHWHLPGPGKPEEKAITRRGWIAAKGQQIGVTAHGEGETVSSLAFEMKARWFEEDDATGLLAALAALGVEAVETGRRAAPEFLHSETPIVVYRLTAPERDAGALTRTETCTSPRSAAAPRCETSYTLDLGG